MPITQKHFEAPVPYDLYLPSGPGPYPLICMTPILGRLSFLEDLFFERRFASYFAENGFAAALIHRPIFDFLSGQGLAQIQTYLENSLKRNQTAFEALLQNKSIDPERTATFGVSFGAVISSLWAAREPRFKAHVLALGGGNLPEIFTQSRDPLMLSYFEAALREQNGNLQELKENLATVFTCEPLNECRTLSPDRVLMILARFDQVVPFKYGMALREKIGNPETVILPLGHYFSILAVPYLKRKAVHFLKRKLLQGVPCSASK